MAVFKIKSKKGVPCRAFCMIDPEVVFSGNGTDIDNRCGQELDLSEAVFE